METFETKYGKVTLYCNDNGIGLSFKSGNYWDEDTLLKLKTLFHMNYTEEY